MEILFIKISKCCEEKNKFRKEIQFRSTWVFQKVHEIFFLIYVPKSLQLAQHSFPIIGRNMKNNQCILIFSTDFTIFIHLFVFMYHKNRQTH